MNCKRKINSDVVRTICCSNTARGAECLHPKPLHILRSNYIPNLFIENPQITILDYLQSCFDVSSNDVFFRRD